LRLAVNNSGEWWKGFKVVAGVVDTGLIRNVLESDSTLTIELMRDIDIGEEHDLWLWSIGAPAPCVLPREDWRVDTGRIVVEAREGAAACIAVAFRGFWLGSVALNRNYSWRSSHASIVQTQNWSLTAAWLRWFRVPVLLPELRAAVRARAEAEPARTFVAWTCDHQPDARVQFSEEHREIWVQVTRTFLQSWNPIQDEALHVLGEMGVIPTDPLEIVHAFERTREGWPNCEGLARIDPGIFSTLIIGALPAAYPDARAEERAVLVKILRKQLMGTDQELSLDEFSTRIGLDRRFASEVINAESLRRERSLALRIALADYSVRQFVCVRLLDEALSQGRI